MTTEKDWVRLPEEAKPMVQSVGVTLEWQDADAVSGTDGNEIGLDPSVEDTVFILRRDEGREAARARDR